MAKSRKDRRRCRPAVEGLESLQLLSTTAAGVWTLNGTAGADTLRVDRNPAKPEMLRAFRNGRLVATRAAATVAEVRLNGLGGNDVLKVDESHGAIAVRAVLAGGAGKNRLVGGSGPTVLDGGPSGTSVLVPGRGPTTLLRGVAVDAAKPFGSLRAFRQFLARAAAKSGSSGGLKGGAGGPVALPTGTPTTPPGPPGSADGSHSTTNVQVPGVDEADIVETDGENLYLLSRGELVIVDARSPGALSVRSRTAVDGSPLAEYLDGGRLTVISSLWEAQPLPATSARALPTLAARGASRVKVVTYDVSDPAKPVAVQDTTLDGNYADSRMVNGKLVLVLQNDLFAGAWGYGGGPVALAGAKASSTAVPGGRPGLKPTDLVNAPADLVLPGFTATAVGPDGAKASKSGLITAPQNVLAPVEGDEANLMSVVVLDTRGATPGPVGSASLLGAYASTLHVTADRIYVFSPRWDDGGSTTSVTRFDLAGGVTPTPVATGTVPGTLIDPYSADDSGGYLRVATTRWLDDRPDNGVSVLQAQGNRLNVVGSVDGLAPGEMLYAARFQGDRAFLVTFQQVDPLFALDLSNPTAPKVVGELKIPGFSRFLQPVAPGYLLGIGREADPATGRTTDLKLSLFDVRDPTSPVLVTSTTIAPEGADWSWSGAEWDPHALGWFPELGVLAVPVQGSVPGPPQPGTDFPSWQEKDGLYVFRVDASAGADALRLLGRVDHDSSVARSARIGDVLFSIADQDVRSVRVIDGGLDPLGRVVIQTETSGWPDGGGGPVLVADARSR